MFVICFISQLLKRSKRGLFVFPPKKTHIWRRHCSIGQSCYSITSKRSIDSFLESSSGWIFFQPSFRLISRKLSRARFVSVRQTSQIALFPFVCSFCIVRAFSFQGQTKTLYRKDQYATCRVCSSQPTLIIKCAFFRHFRNGKEAGLC